MFSDKRTLKLQNYSLAQRDFALFITKSLNARGNVSIFNFSVIVFCFCYYPFCYYFASQHCFKTRELELCLNKVPTWFPKKSVRLSKLYRKLKNFQDYRTTSNCRDKVTKATKVFALRSCGPNQFSPHTVFLYFFYEFAWFVFCVTF